MIIWLILDINVYLKGILPDAILNCLNINLAM